MGVCMCEFCNMWVFWQLYGCFGNMCTCIYCVYVLFPLCIFFLFVTSVRATATEWKLNYSIAVNNNNNNSSSRSVAGTSLSINPVWWLWWLLEYLPQTTQRCLICRISIHVLVRSTGRQIPMKCKLRQLAGNYSPKNIGHGLKGCSSLSNAFWTFYDTASRISSTLIYGFSTFALTSH